MSNNLYFAYGSNLLPEQVYKRVAGAKLLGVARLSDYCFGYFRRSVRYAPGGAADIKQEPGREVWGACWLLPEWQQMDGYEGVNKGAYKRIDIQFILGEELIQGQTYSCVNKVAEIRPIHQYWDKVYKGAISVGLPESYIHWLREHYLSLQN